MTVEDLVALLGTYLVHSTLAIVVMGYMAAAAPVRPGLRAWMLRLTLVGPMATAWVGQAHQVAKVVVVDVAVFDRVEAGSAAIVPDTSWVLAAFVTVWLVGASAGCLQLLGAWVVFSRRIACRLPLEAGTALRSMASELAPRRLARRFRLSCASALPSPVAFGVFKPEICLPHWIAADLPQSLQRAMLAHELGHLQARDPSWRWATLIVSRVLWIQPLNFWIARELVRQSELAADRWAAHKCGDPLAVASCLTAVGRRFRSGSPSLVPAAVARRSLVRERVRSLLRTAVRSTPEGWHAKSTAAGTSLAILVAIAWLAPAVETGGARVSRFERSAGEDRWPSTGRVSFRVTADAPASARAPTQPLGPSVRRQRSARASNNAPRSPSACSSNSPTQANVGSFGAAHGMPNTLAPREVTTVLPPALPYRPVPIESAGRLQS